MIEQLERLAARDDAEIHVYSQRVEDLKGVTPFADSCSSRAIVWHKVPGIGGPHLFAYLWWFVANQLQRFWDSQIRGIKFDLVYSPGINALNADSITIHIVFHEFYRQVRPLLSFRKTSIAHWPRLLHRLMYYRLIMVLERIVYRRRDISLSSVSGLVASQLEKYFQRTDVVVIPNGVDTNRFSPSLRLARRASTRGALNLGPEEFVLLFIGNDWKKKGLDCLLEALAACHELRIKLLVVGTDHRAEYEARVRQSLSPSQVSFFEPSSDVMHFYAAADAYVGPSLEDAFGLPLLEAMACGLPVIASPRAGASAIIRDAQNGLLLRNPRDARELARLLRKLYGDSIVRSSLGESAARSASENTWDRNAAATWEFLKSALAAKVGGTRLLGTLN